MWSASLIEPGACHFGQTDCSANFHNPPVFHSPVLELQANRRPSRSQSKRFIPPAPAQDAFVFMAHILFDLEIYHWSVSLCRIKDQAQNLKTHQSPISGQRSHQPLPWKPPPQKTLPTLNLFLTQFFTAFSPKQRQPPSCDFFFQEISCMRFPIECNFVVSKLAGYPSPQSCNICVGETFFFRVLTLTLSFHNYLLTIVIPIWFPSLDLTGRIFMMQFSMFPWLPFDFLPATGQRRLGLCLWVSVRGCFTSKPKTATSQVHAQLCPVIS